MKNEKLKIIVRQRSGIVFTGDGRAVSSKNRVGPFDILPLHANFVSVIVDNLTLHLEREKREIPLSRGILRVKENTVEVYLGI